MTFPFGPTLGKVVKFGGTLPVKFEIEALYIPVHPVPNGEQFQLQLNVIPVVLSPILAPVLGE